MLDLSHVRGISLFLIAGLVGTLPISAQAQPAVASGSANVVNQSLEVTKITDLDFGQILPGPNTKNVSVDPNTSANAASFEITGSRTAWVVVNYSTSDLTTGGGHVLPYQEDVVGHHNQNARSGARPISNPVRLVGREGNYWVWVGGAITVDPNQAPGLYETTITVTASYY